MLLPLLSDLDLEFDSEGSGVEDTFLPIDAQQTSNRSSRDRVLTEQCSQNSHNMAKLRASTTGQCTKKPTREEKQRRLDDLVEKTAAKRARDSLENGTQFDSKEQEMRALQARLKELEQENPPDEGAGSGRTSPVQGATSRFSTFSQHERMCSCPVTAENREIQAFHAQNSAPPGGFPWPTSNPWSGDPNMIPPGGHGTTSPSNPRLVVLSR